MARLRDLVPLLSSLVLFASCGGRTSTDAGASPDAGPADATVAVDADPPIDSPSGEFCEGSSKAEHGGVLVSPTSVTSSLLIMNCCDGFRLRFHTEKQLGFDVSVTVQQFGGLLQSGTFELPADGGGIGVSVQDPAWPAGQETTVSGSLRIDAPGSYEELSYATACLSVSAPGQALDGTRLYASNVAIAPYAWASRLEVRLLQDPTITATEAAAVPLASLQLADPTALFDLMAVEWYDATSHSVAWDGWHSSEYIIKELPAVGVQGLPFVVTANGQRAYLGAFVSTLSSVALNMPVIVIDSMKESGFRIESGYPSDAPPGQDARNHPQVLGVLESAGKLVK